MQFVKYQSSYYINHQQNQNRLLDWNFLFNLGVFVLFICSIFYVCLHRYRNKKKNIQNIQYNQRIQNIQNIQNNQNNQNNNNNNNNFKKL